MKQKKQVTSVGLSLFNCQDDARSNKHKIHINLHLYYSPKLKSDHIDPNANQKKYNTPN